MPLPGAQIDLLLAGIYNGSISVFDLPTFLYAYTVEELDGSFFSGYGTIPKGDVKVIEKAVNFRQNLGSFSGVKTFHEVNDLTAFVFDEDGFKRPFKEFAELGRAIDEKYNLDWLKTEQDTVFLQSQNSRKWLKAEVEADIFPTLEYVTVGDDRVRPDHAALDGLRRPVNDPIWKTIHPQNGWRCRCTIKQHESTEISSAADVKAQTRLIKAEFAKQKKKNKFTFDYNPGQTDFIFKERGKGRHDYFKVPRAFNDELKDNFGFPSASEVTGKHI